MTLPTDVVVHHLRLFGFGRAGRDPATAAPLVVDGADPRAADDLKVLAASGGTAVLLDPTPAFAGDIGVSFVTREGSAATPSLFREVGSSGTRRLRSLHASDRLGGAMRPVLIDAEGIPAWGWAERAPGVLVVGTDLAGDLVRYRQGDPGARPPTEALWGIGGERPIYLFEAQRAGEDPQCRHADLWCAALADALVRDAGLVAAPILPGGAPGAIVITGDDDQAPLDCYAEQLRLLGDLPITYFLHPLTKHTRDTLRDSEAGRRIEWALHPDALDAPRRYPDLMAEQAAWFRELAGFDALTVRNHGFLNDGYWGHLPAWDAAGIRGSSNLPGFDGQALNGSLLPARLAIDGALTSHWSIVTAVGDGVVFIHGDDDATAGGRITSLADRIMSDAVPGVIVVNLHPANVARTVGMHDALHALVARGFVPWTLSDCLAWFGDRDGGSARPAPAPPEGATGSPSSPADSTAPVTPDAPGVRPTSTALARSRAIDVMRRLARWLRSP